MPRVRSSDNGKGESESDKDNHRRARHMSCEGCRKRKLKCSRTYPCQACELRDEDCVWYNSAPTRTSEDLDLDQARSEVIRLRNVVEFLVQRMQRMQDICSGHSDCPRPDKLLPSLSRSSHQSLGSGASSHLRHTDWARFSTSRELNAELHNRDSAVLFPDDVSHSHFSASRASPDVRVGSNQFVTASNLPKPCSRHGLASANGERSLLASCQFGYTQGTCLATQPDPFTIPAVTSYVTSITSQPSFE